MSVVKSLTARFESFVGYLEKKSNSNLDSFTANAGTNNYTLFSRDYYKFSGINAQGQPWCDVFIDTVFCYHFGVEMAKRLLGGFSAYTPTSANYFKKIGRWHTSDPIAGDIIFFKNSSGICHTGYVYKATDKYVYTIEGNTSNASGVVANGGGVARKSYDINNSRIAGYGRPAYSIVGSVDGNVSTSETQTSVQIGVKTVTITLNQLSVGSKGKQVQTAQRLLEAFGFSVGSCGADGDFGNATLNAVKAFQKGNSLTADGIIGSQTWTKLLK